jgi:hypothetical protein
MRSAIAASKPVVAGANGESPHTVADIEEPGGGAFVETAQQGQGGQAGPATAVQTSFVLSQEDRGILDYLKGTTINGSEQESEQPLISWAFLFLETLGTLSGCETTTGPKYWGGRATACTGMKSMSMTRP